VEGVRIKLLPLERILKSKQAILRDKDVAHIFHIKRFLKGRKKLGNAQ
jgi:predicted nucleotidyltransferase